MKHFFKACILLFAFYFHLIPCAGQPKFFSVNLASGINNRISFTEEEWKILYNTCEVSYEEAKKNHQKGGKNSNKVNKEKISSAAKEVLDTWPEKENELLNNYKTFIAAIKRIPLLKAIFNNQDALIKKYAFCKESSLNPQDFDLNTFEYLRTRQNLLKLENLESLKNQLESGVPSINPDMQDLYDIFKRDFAIITKNLNNPSCTINPNDLNQETINNFVGKFDANIQKRFFKELDSKSFCLAVKNFKALHGDQQNMLCSYQLNDIKEIFNLLQVTSKNYEQLDTQNKSSYEIVSRFKNFIYQGILQKIKQTQETTYSCYSWLKSLRSKQKNETPILSVTPSDLNAISADQKDGYLPAHWETYKKENSNSQASSLPEMQTPPIIEEFLKRVDDVADDFPQNPQKYPKIASSRFLINQKPSSQNEKEWCIDDLVYYHKDFMIEAGTKLKRRWDYSYLRKILKPECLDNSDLVKQYINNTPIDLDHLNDIAFSMLHQKNDDQKDEESLYYYGGYKELAAKMPRSYFDEHKMDIALTAATIAFLPIGTSFRVITRLPGLTKHSFPSLAQFARMNAATRGEALRETLKGSGITKRLFVAKAATEEFLYKSCKNRLIDVIKQ